MARGSNIIINRFRGPTFEMVRGSVSVSLLTINEKLVSKSVRSTGVA